MAPAPSESQLSLYRVAAGDRNQVKQCVEECQQEGFLKCVQSECISVVVGVEKCGIPVHEGLLIRYSPVFRQMCRLPFQEAQRRIIQLPEDGFSTFGLFITWIYRATPHLDSNTQSSALVKLGIFAEKYQVSALVEQIFDHMFNKVCSDNQFLLAPSDIRAAFEGTSRTSPLRQFCALFLHKRCPIVKNKISRKWQDLFEEVPELGWHYFKLDKFDHRIRSSYIKSHPHRKASIKRGTYDPYRHLLPVSDIDQALKKLYKIGPEVFDQQAWDNLNGPADEDGSASACSSDVYDEEEKPGSEHSPQEAKKE